jgi:hypothetical protein
VTSSELYYKWDKLRPELIKLLELDGLLTVAELSGLKWNNGPTPVTAWITLTYYLPNPYSKDELLEQFNLLLRLLNRRLNKHGLQAVMTPWQPRPIITGSAKGVDGMLTTPDVEADLIISEL